MSSTIAPGGPPATSKTPSPRREDGGVNRNTPHSEPIAAAATAPAAPGSPVGAGAEARAHLEALANPGTPPKRQPSSEQDGGGGDTPLIVAPADKPAAAAKKPATKDAATGTTGDDGDDDEEGLVVEELARDTQTTDAYYNKWDRAAKELIAADEEEDAAAEAASDAAVGKGKYHNSEAEAKDMARRAALKAAKAAFDGKRVAEDGQKQVLGEGYAAGSTVVLDAAALGGRPVLTLQNAEGCTITLPPGLRCAAGAHSANGGGGASDGAGGRPLIKLFVDGCADCTIVVACPLITGTIDVSHCERCTLVVAEPRAGVTVQADLCAKLTVRYARGVLGRAGGDRHRLFHAGVSGLLVEADVPSGPPSTWADPGNTNTLSYSATADYQELLAAEAAAGRAAKGPPEEVQFVTELVDGVLRTERAVRGREQLIPSSASEVAAMKQAAAAHVAGGGAAAGVQGGDELDEAEALRVAAAAKLEGNEAFKDRHYTQAAVYYTKAIDAAPDGAKVAYLCYSNRAACWLKLGHPEKARADAQKCTVLAPDYCKGWFRLGLALHMQERYGEAGPALARAASIEPKNKQVAEALTFARVKLRKQMSKQKRGR